MITFDAFFSVVFTLFIDLPGVTVETVGEGVCIYFFKYFQCEAHNCLTHSRDRPSSQLQKTNSSSRVRTGPWNPGKSWNFTFAFSRTAKALKMTSSPGKTWTEICKLFFDHMIFTVSVAYGTACKAY